LDIRGIMADAGTIKTGIHRMDRMANIFQPGALTVIAARPGMGKSTFMRHLIRLNSLTAPTLMFTFEENAEMVAAKLSCELAGVPFETYAGGFTNAEERKRIADAMEDLAMYKLEYTDSTMDADQIAAECRRQARNGNPPRLVFVDHLQHMRHQRVKGDNIAAGYERSVNALKDLARELKCTVILLAQLNRDVEGRELPKPQLSDLRDTGALEISAWNVLFIWTDDMKEPRRYLSLAKQRNGKRIEDRVIFVGALGRFENETKVGQEYEETANDQGYGS